ncbi:hypothetical protein VB780_08095 [Leptolyngbya sp. CCNP1308]|uniref:hypothetical protein n=1 Tax=Leptolyngbya sp. CCNP1308 TaxID=3110255 RepID=UPI002B1EC3D4|nr:hypothetical protein [Leptolyngbya sp. CCNP1308]MEA5448522.1 hypothetical protein [Leptolyngbya sp. CCNP1308]
MSHSVEKQAVPVEFFEQIHIDKKLQILVDQLWGCGNGMFSWFTRFPIASRILPSPIDEFKEDYKAIAKMLGNPFESEADLEGYCALLEQKLEQLKADEPFLIQRRVHFDTRTDEQIYSFLLEELKIKFPTLDAEFAHTAIWGGERINPASNLRYFLPDEVNVIANVLSQIELDELLSHFDDLKYDSNYWLEECRKTIQAFKTCFTETSERQQVILTKTI